MFKKKQMIVYAHILIVVAFLVVNFFTKMDMARNHGLGQVPGQVEMNPTDLPELFKPSRDLGNPKKVKFLETNNFRKILKS